MSQEKTEKATAHRLKKARQEGQAPQARDFVTTLVTVLGFVALLLTADSFGARFTLLARSAIDHAFAPDFRVSSVALSVEIGQAALDILAPLALVALIVAPLATFAGQGGFTPKPFKIRFEALDPIKNAQQKFSKQNFFELLKTLIRFAAILALMLWIMRAQFGALFMTVFCGLDCGASVALDSATLLVAAIFAVMAVLALVDLLLQRRFYEDQMKMSKEEVKREHKETEGDPQMKSARKAVARRVMAVTITEAADYATALIVDGAGRAVAVIAGAPEPGEAIRVTVALAASGSAAEQLLAAVNARRKPVVTDPRLAAPLMGLSGLQPVVDPALSAAVAGRLRGAGALG